jgi:DNA-binding CsgD family transcriptional regulator
LSVALRHDLSVSEIISVEAVNGKCYNKEAADKQEISVHTFNTHIKRACKKLGVLSKKHAVKKLIPNA